MALVSKQGQCLFEAGPDVGWDQRRFAAPAHHDFWMFPDGGPALEASLSHPTMKQAMALVSKLTGFRSQRGGATLAESVVS